MRKHLWDLDVDGETILKRILNLQAVYIHVSFLTDELVL